jgi:ubiquinone biosynthesis protein UbiJ
VSLALLQTALLLPLESSVNALLALDAAAPARLARLNGKTLAIRSTAPELALYLSVGNGRLRLSPIYEGPATATLRGPARALLRLLLQDETPASLAPFGVELQGSTAFMQELQTLLRDLDIDWQYHLGRLLGDLPVSAVDRSLDATRRFSAATLDAVRSNVEDYLAHESGLLPSRTALQQFQSGLLDLQLQLDRLEARCDSYICLQNAAKLATDPAAATGEHARS